MPPESDENPLPERILDATVSVLRRHGADKANVVDVAKLLGMSHANIYRHFPTKKALLDAVATRWLHAIVVPLAAIADDRNGPAADRLTAWFNTLRTAKQRKVLDDPELFRVYHSLAVRMGDKIDDHVRALVDQLARIIADGIAAGDFAPQPDATAAAKAFLQATASFHHPALLSHEPRATDAEAAVVLNLLLAGLRAR